MAASMLSASSFAGKAVVSRRAAPRAAARATVAVSAKADRTLWCARETRWRTLAYALRKPI